MNIPSPISNEMESFIKDCILGAVDEINSYTNRRIVEMNPNHDMTIIITEKTEYYDGYNTNILYLKNYPVVELNPNARNVLQYLKEDESWEDIIQPPDTIGNSVLLLDYGKLRLLKNYKFPEGTKNIKVIYKSGYSAENLPEDLKLVCFEKSGLKFLNSAYGNYQRLGIEFHDLSNQRTKFINIDEKHTKIMDKYRRPTI
jgi:hypothetical protein